MMRVEPRREVSLRIRSGWTAVALTSAAAVAVALAACLRPRRACEPDILDTAEPADGGIPTPTAPPGAPAEGVLPPILIDPEIIVHKSQRRLEILGAGVVVKRYRIALGPDPVGHKVDAGDGRTPEGVYHIVSKHPDEPLRRVLTLSYPNITDADAALGKGRLDRRSHRAILAAHKRHEPPPRLTPLGGPISLHGGGTRPDGWTDGSVALNDTDVEELDRALPLGARVTIVA
jgi:hypothetical protein